MSTLRFASPFILLIIAAATLAGDGGALQRYPLTSESMEQWRLPDRLNEISGLAMTPDGRLFAVDDEIAVVYEVDFDDGGLLKAFALGKPTEKGDFEGIAFAGGLVYLMTSSARIYVAAEGSDGQRVTFDVFKTKLGKQCEFEGFTQSVEHDKLYLLCKKRRNKADIDGLAIFAWSIESREWLPDETIMLPEREILRELRFDRLSPSGLAVDPETGNFIIVAARQRSLIEIDVDGKLVSARNFELPDRHRQAEGIELATNGRLLIADEGGNYRARLAVYRQEVIKEIIND